MFKLGVMGCGAVASFGHLPAIATTHGLELAALYDPDPARVNELGAHYPNAWRFTDAEDFFQTGSELNAVVIASPSFAHIANLRLAAEHGKHVLCEKPLGASDEEASAMIDLMRSKDLMLYTGFCYRFSPVSLQIKQLINEGAIGTVRSIRLIYLWGLDGKYLVGPNGEAVLNARREARMEEGGPLVDCGVHLIDLARWWLGSDVAKFRCDGVWVEDYAAPDHVRLNMVHDSGAATLVETSFSYTSTSRDPASVFTYEIIGANGLIRYDRDGWRLEMRNAGGTMHYPGASEKNFNGMYSGFEEWLRTGNTGILASGNDGLIATRIATAATQEAIAARCESTRHIREERAQQAAPLPMEAITNNPEQCPESLS
jgi:predicted dehydrogenase